MKRMGVTLLVLTLAASIAPQDRPESARAAQEQASQEPTGQGDHRPSLAHATTCWGCARQRGSLTENWFGLGDKLAEEGLTVALSLTQIYQLNLDGGLATHRHAGRYAGSYDLTLGLDLEKVLGIPGGSLNAVAEGSWSDGLDDSSIGSLFGVNADAAGDRGTDLTQLYYQQVLLEGRLVVRAGKLDLSDGFECRGCPVAFDASRFAWDETTQFLNGALAGNPTIPLPEEGIGAAMHVEPVDGFYVAAGVTDAQADRRETGLNTAFHGPDNFFGIFELGAVHEIPSGERRLLGAYRVGLWYDPQPKQRLDGAGMERDDVGLYLSFDQDLLRESPDPGDRQGLGAFLRYGYAHDDVNEIDQFWSLGVQYQGLIPGRDNDVVGLGVAQGRLVQAAGFTASHETAAEVYYNVAVTPWLGISPSIQYICNPGGGSVDHATVIGVRAQLAF